MLELADAKEEHFVPECSIYKSAGFTLLQQVENFVKILKHRNFYCLLTFQKKHYKKLQEIIEKLL